MQKSYNPEAVQATQDRRSRKLLIGLCAGVGVILLGLVRVLAGEGTDGVVMLILGGTAVIGCVIGLIRAG
jgi:hypothetical protein